MKDIFITSCNAEETFLSPLHPRPTTIDVHLRSLAPGASIPCSGVCRTPPRRPSRSSCVRASFR